MIKNIVVTWLAISIVLLSILVAWLFVRWFDAVMVSVSIGAIFGMLATFNIWLLALAAYPAKKPEKPTERLRPTVKRCDDAGAVSSINGEWRVVQ